MKRFGLVVGLASAVGCGDGEALDAPRGPQISVGVLDLPATALAFDVDLRLVSPDGWLSVDVPLESRHYGDANGNISYIAACDASGDGVNRVELTLREPVPNAFAVPAGLVIPAATSFGVMCESNQDFRLDYAFELAKRSVVDDVTTVVFADMQCRVSHACSADDVGVQVVCDSPAGPSTLGVRDVQLVCGGYREPLAAIGRSDIRVGGSADASAASLDGSAVEGNVWSARVQPRNLPTCNLEAEVVAAPVLEGGRADRCTAWPVLKVALPLGPNRCGRANVEVAYAEAGGPTVDAMIDDGVVSRPTMSTAATCVAAPLVAERTGTPSDGTTTMREGEQGFFDLSLRYVFPE